MEFARMAKSKLKRVSLIVRPTSIPSTEPTSSRLLYSRRQAQLLLGGVSVHTMIRWEHAGILRPIKPGNAPTGMTFYSHANLMAVARGDDDAA
jgi:hypothetical protein